MHVTTQSKERDEANQTAGHRAAQTAKEWVAERKSFETVRRRWLAIRAAARSFVRRTLPNEAQHLFALTLVLGVVCGLAAVAFHLTIRFAESLLIDRVLHAPGWHAALWIVLTPTLGGLIGGALLMYVPGARGSGIPQVKQAFAVEGGRVRVRDAIGKFFVGAVQIGSGASLGREGPTVQICAGAASLLARATSLPPRNMRRLTPVGAAAGIAAAFNAPIAAVTFTIEEVVGTLDQAVLSGVVVAAALAAVIERGILGTHPVIEVQEQYGLDHASSLPFYALLGVAAAFVSIAFSDGLLKLRLWFRDLRVIPPLAQPAVGGLVTGLLMLLAARGFQSEGINGGGYSTLGLALAGKIGLELLLVLCVSKLIATVFSYASGGAGGIFAPVLFIGAMLGGAVGHLDVQALGHEPHQLGAFALVGMGAVFAGVIRAPITSVLIIFEMTGGYGLVLPLMLANATAYMLATRLRPVPIYEALLAQDGVHLPHGAPAVHALDRLRVADAMTAEVVSARDTSSIAQARALVEGRSFASLPVLDQNGAVRGMVSVAPLQSATLDPNEPITALVHAGVKISADAPLLRAVVQMNDLNVRQLLVVDPESESKLVGVFTMSDLVRAHARVAPGRPSTISERPRARTQFETRARSLMLPAGVVTPNASLRELQALLNDGPNKALVVCGTESEFSVILPEYLSEYARDEALHALLQAADLAHRAPAVQESAPVPALIQAVANPGVDAAVVLSDIDQQPIGVVTKNDLVSVLFDWYLARTPPPVAAKELALGHAPAR